MYNRSISPLLLAAAVLLPASAAWSQTWTNGNGNGVWSQDGNWSPPSFPNNPNAAAIISLDLAAPATINLDNPEIVLNNLVVGDSAGPTFGFTIAPGSGGQLNFQRSLSAADPSITSANGPNAITAPVVSDLARLTIGNTGGGSLTLSSLDRASGGVFRFSGAGGTTGTTVTPGGGLSSTNGIGNVFATYNDSDWIIYNPGTGAVGQFTGYTSLAGATATSNVNVNGSATVSSAQTINSLRIVSGAGGQAVTVNDVLTVGSGGILRAGGNHNYSINGTGTLSTGSNELVIHNNSNNQIAVNAQVASNGVTINSGNRIIFNNATNNFGSGDFNIVRGAARFSYGVTFTGNFHQAAENVDFFSLQLAHSDVTTFEREARINGFIVPVGANTPSVVVAETGIMTGYGESRVTTTIEGAINPGVAERGGTLLFTEGLTLGASSFTFIDLGGTLPGDAGAFYDQINSSSITEGITILDGAELEVSLSTTFIPDPSDIFYIINREDGGTFDTTFEGLEEGAFVSLGDDYVAEITYLANWTGNQATSSLTGGNDIALYNVRLVPEPASAGLLLMGALAVALRRRRR